MFNIINTDTPIEFTQINYINIAVEEEEKSVEDLAIQAALIVEGTQRLQKCIAEISKTSKVKRIVSVDREIDYVRNCVTLHCFFEIEGKVMYNEDLGIRMENGRITFMEDAEDTVQEAQNKEEMKGDNN